MFTNKSPFKTSRDDRYFEDYQQGDIHEFGVYRLGEAEIIEFAQQYDPQFFHTDPEKAKKSAFDGIISSGFHNCSIAMRLLVDNYLSTVAGLASPGLNEVRWLNYARPGDDLWVRVTVKAARQSASKPDRGVLTSVVEMFNQNDTPIMSMETVGFVLRRP